MTGRSSNQTFRDSKILKQEKPHCTCFMFTDITGGGRGKGDLNSTPPTLLPLEALTQFRCEGVTTTGITESVNEFVSISLAMKKNTNSCGATYN